MYSQLQTYLCLTLYKCQFPDCLFSSLNFGATIYIKFVFFLLTYVNLIIRLANEIRREEGKIITMCIEWIL